LIFLGNWYYLYGVVGVVQIDRSTAGSVGLSAARARKLLLRFDDVSEAPHFDRVAFRTPRRIFATLAGDGRDVNFMFDPLAQESFCEMAPRALAPVPGAWGRVGATRCDLEKVDEATFLAAAEAAHARASEPRPSRRKKR
jgi:hypothetical protein